MIQRIGCATLALVVGLAPASAQSPEPATAPALQRILGEVTAIDAGARQLAVTTDTGDKVTVAVDEKTTFLRAQPGARDLTGATPLTLEEIAVGDRVLARIVPAGDQARLAARQVVVMSRADLAQKHEQERADWRHRGVSGVIKAIDPATQDITVEARSLMGSQEVVVSTAGGKATFKRYAPESVRFIDARPSSFAELQVGDQIRVLGDRAADGSKVLAEQVVSGSFQIVSGAVKAVDTQRGEVTLLDNETGKPLKIAVGPDAMVRRLPPEMAQRLAMRSRMGGPGGAGPGGPGRRQGRPPGAEAGDRPEGGGPPAGGRRMGAQTLQDMLERLPALPIEEIKPGDQVAVSSTKGRDPGRVTAVVLLAGIEPLLEARSRGTAGREESLGLAPGALDLGVGIP